MKKSLMASLLALVLTVALVGCGGSVDIKRSAAKMQTVVADMQKAIDKGDTAAATKGADDLEAAWATFEDAVKDKSKETYAKVEEHLEPLRAGAKQEKLDQKTLTEHAKGLNEALAQLAK